MGHDSRKLLNRPRSLGRGVLAVMGLVEHERPGLEATQLPQPRGNDVVVHDGDLRARGQAGRVGVRAGGAGTNERLDAAMR